MMKFRVLAMALLLVLSVAAAKGPRDFARQWPVLGSCTAVSLEADLAKAPTLTCEGAFAVSLDESVYRQVAQADLGDVAAFNAAGEALAFGPMPAAYSPPPRSWVVAPWFALPRQAANDSPDLHLHVTRSPQGELRLDATLSRESGDRIQDILVDVRSPHRAVEAIELELALDAADFSAEITVEASDDLQAWQTLVAAATIAQLRQGGQSLVRRHVEFPAQEAGYLRLRVLGATGGIPLTGIKLSLQPLSPSSESIERNSITADFVRRDGRAFIYSLPARVPVERVNISLGDDNAVAAFSVSARDAGQRDWGYVGQLTAFRLRGAGMALDNEAMDVAMLRRQEWRVEANIDLDRVPVLELSYRPEQWLLLTHGKSPFVVVAGSRSKRRGDFPLDALVAQVRSRMGRDWKPVPAQLGAMQTSGGDAALSTHDPASTRNWVLWSILGLGAMLIVVMVLRLLKAPPSP